MNHNKITANSILNYIYAEKDNQNPMDSVLNFIQSMFNFSMAHGYIKQSTYYITYVFDILNSFTSKAPIPEKYHQGINKYLYGIVPEKYPSAPPEFIEAIRVGTIKLSKDYFNAKERTRETRKIIENSSPLFPYLPENSDICEYIDYIKNYDPTRPKVIFYGDLYNIGFIQGIRAERARKNGKTVSHNERASSACYTGVKHKKRYKVI